MRSIQLTNGTRPSQIRNALQTHNSIRRMSGSLTLLAALILLAAPTAAWAQGSRGDRPVRVPPTSVSATPSPTPETIQLTKPGQNAEISGLLKVGGGRMEVVDSPIGGGVLTSNLYIRQLNQPGSPAHLCWRVAPDRTPGLILTTCTTSQSSLRYKLDLRPFLGGLNVINRLNPVNFEWKNGGTRDIGLVAEEVAVVEPMLTFNNDKNQVEGVKYETLSVVLVNAVKEQQAQIVELSQQIQTQQEQIRQQQLQIETLLKRLAP